MYIHEVTTLVIMTNIATNNLVMIITILMMILLLLLLIIIIIIILIITIVTVITITVASVASSLLCNRGQFCHVCLSRRC